MDAARGQNARLMKSATYAAVGVAATLIAVKFAAWLLTGSVALLSSLVDSLLDGAASLVNLFAVRHALAPADREHRFGHGKLEAIAALGQAAFIIGSALLVLFQAGDRLIHPVAIAGEQTGIAVMVFAILLTVALVAFQRHVVRRTGSVAIRADALHYAGDVFINAGVIVALILSARLDWPAADPLIGGAIAVYLMVNAGRILALAFDNLMDRELPDDERARIIEIAIAHPEVSGVHDLRTRRAGTQVFVQMHLEMDAEMTLSAAHRVADAVEAGVQQAFPGAEVLIHEDPEGLEEPGRAGFDG